MIPLNPDDLGGKSVVVEQGFEILADRGKALIVRFDSLPAEIEWIEDFRMMYCQRQHEPNTLKTIRKASGEEIVSFRVPVWIQDEETPECCGKPMVFVGQVNGNSLCGERP